ncbi:tail length tape measure protein [Ochrobactrum sp. BH3]|nr:tail length tape measure protein [Ochrobactrum sp. BH3]
MAVTADQVVVELQAKTEAYNQKIAQASANFTKNISAMSKAAIAAGSASAVAFNSATGAFEKAAPAVKKTGDASKMAQQQMRNLAFQFQDIGTMLAAGQSPFMLLAQQLPQVTMYGGKMTGVMGALRATVSNLVSPLGLATTAFVLLGSAAIDYFTAVDDGDKEAQKKLEEQAKIVQQVAERWGKAVPAIKAYADELERVREASEKQQAGEIVAQQSIDKVKEELFGLSSLVEKAMASLAGSGQETEEVFNKLQPAIGGLNAKLQDGTATSADLEKAQKAMAEVATGYSTPAILELANAFAVLIPQIKQALGIADAARFDAAPFADAHIQLKNFVSEQERLNGLTGKQLALEKEIASVQSDARKATGSEIGKDEARRIAEERLAATERRAQERRKPRRSAEDRKAERDANAYRDLVKSAQDRIDQMELEQQLVGKAGVAAEVMRLKLELLQKAQDKGRTVTEAQRKEIDKLAESYAKAADKLAAMHLAEELNFEREQMFRSPTEQRVNSTLRNAGIDIESPEGKALSASIRLNEKLVEARDLTTDFAQSFTQDLMNGVSAMDALGKAAGRLGEQLINMALNQLINNLFKNLTGILGGGTSYFPPVPTTGIGLFADGGYTGSGGKNQPAGVVHKGEVVWSQNDVRRAGGVGVVEAMRRGAAGYSGGGAPGMANISPFNVPRLPTMPSMTQTNNKTTTNNAPVINVSVDGATGNAEVAAMVQQGVAKGIQAWQGSTQFASAVSYGFKQGQKRGMIR